MALPQQNHYRLLDVPFTASRKDITTAYKKAMRQWHPDQFRGTDKALAEEQSRRINQAYSVLSDPRKRADYDRSIRVEAMQAEIMERYVPGSSGWNLDGSGPMPADAPRRPMTSAQKAEMRVSDRNAMRSLIISFAFLALAAILLLFFFAILENGIGAIF
ncbi:MAG: J domain-containing protein [Thermomicrobiales bacterium]|nr:J domain-containing protein [Thermomicrobiales bacterium]